MSRDIMELLPDILPSVSGCPPMLVTQHLSSAVREFLYDTNVWKQWVSPIDVVADQALYTFANHLMDTDERWARTKEVDILRWAPTGRELDFLTQEQLQARDPKWRSRTAAVPSSYTYELQDSAWGRTVRLYPIPDTNVTAALEARLVISTHTYADIGRNAYDSLDVLLPDVIFETYRDAFVAGALSRLLKLPKKDWTDRNEAAYQESIFNAAKVSAKSEGDVDHGSPVLTVAYGGL